MTPVEQSLALQEEGLCGQLHHTRAHTWLCHRPFHGGDHPNQDAYRRRNGRTPSADKHVYRRAA